MAPKTVLSYGEILWDIMPETTALGGAPFNFAYRMSTLGARSIFASSLGHDDLGDEAFARAVALGMDTSCIQRSAVSPTGTVTVSFDTGRNPDYEIIPGVAYDCIQPDDALLGHAAESDCICFGTLIQRSPVSRTTLYTVLEAAEDACKVYDVNLRKRCYSRETIADSLARADVLKINDDEAAQLIDMFDMHASDLPSFAVDALKAWDLDVCVVTLGARGALAVSRSGEMVYAAGYAVNLVDSLGAGDSFTAGMVHGLITGGSLGDACASGNVLGALVASKSGGTPPVTQKEMRTLREGGAARVCDERFERYRVD